MPRKVFVTRVRPERREDYVDAHRKVPEDLLARYGAEGMRSCEVWLRGDDLVMIIDAEDHGRIAAALAGDPVSDRWEAYVGEMKQGEWQEMRPVFEKVWR